MRSEKELQSSSYPFLVELVGSDDICVRNLETGVIVEGTRQTRLLGDDGQRQSDELTLTAVTLANERRRTTGGIQAETVVSETIEEVAARIAASAA